MKSILALAGKDLRLLLRDKVGFFFVFFFPLVYAVFFGTIFGGPGGDGTSSMKIVVVDEDGTETSQRFVKKLVDAKEFEVYTKSSEGKPLTRADAVNLVRRGKVTAHVILPAGFGEAQSRLFQGESLRIDAGTDPARKAESAMLQGMLTKYAFEELQNLFGDRDAMRRQARSGLDAALESETIDPITRAVLSRFLNELDTFLRDMPEDDGEGDGDEDVAGEDSASGAGSKSANPLAGWNPIDVRVDTIAMEKKGPRPESSYEITMPQSFVWMFLGTAAAFAISLVMERTRGTLMRLRSAPVTLTQILAGKALACFITTIAALVMLYLFFLLVFRIEPDSYPHLALAFLCSAVAFVGIMMLVSVMGKTEAAVGGIGWAFLLIMAMTGGGMVPLMFMPSWLETVSHFSFVKWSIYAVEGAVWREFSFAEMLQPCAILLGIGAVSFFVGLRIFKVTVD